MIAKNAKIVITGGAGFVGSHVVAALQKKGYEKFSRAVLQRWKKTARWKDACAPLKDGMEPVDVSGLAYEEKTRRGRRIDNEFEKAVFTICEARLSDHSSFILPRRAAWRQTLPDFAK